MADAMRIPEGSMDVSQLRPRRHRVGQSLARHALTPAVADLGEYRAARIANAAEDTSMAETPADPVTDGNEVARALLEKVRNRRGLHPEPTLSIVREEGPDDSNQK